MINRVSFFNGNFRETTAIAECRTADARHTASNRDAHEATATRERIIADACHTLGNHDVREATAITERIIADASHVIRNRDARETTATGKRILADDRHTFGNRNAREAPTRVERIISDTRHTIPDDRRFDITFVTVPWCRITSIIRHRPRAADRQDARFSIKRPRKVIPFCAAGTAMGLGRRGQNEKRRQGGGKDD